VEYTNTALNTSDNLSSYLPYSHRSSDVVYEEEGDSDTAMPAGVAFHCHYCRANHTVQSSMAIPITKTST